MFVARLQQRLRDAGLESRVAAQRDWRGRQPGVFPRPGLPGPWGRLDPLCWWFQSQPEMIVHVHASWHIMAPVLLVLRARGKKLVITVHSELETEVGRAIPAYARWAARRVAAWRTGIRWVAVSRKVRTLLEEEGIPGALITTCPAYLPEPGVDMNTLPQPLAQFLAAHRPALGIYGFRFNFHEGHDLYGFDTAIKTLAAILPFHPGAGLVCLCPDAQQNPAYLEKLQRFADALGCAQAVYWQTAPLQQPGALWRRLAIYVRPSWSDGDALAVRECLGFGVPVIASSVVERPEGTVLCRAGEAAGLADAIQRVLAEPPGRAPPAPDVFGTMQRLYGELEPEGASSTA